MIYPIKDMPLFAQRCPVSKQCVYVYWGRTVSYLNISLKKRRWKRMISARIWGVRGIGRERWVSGYKVWLARRKKRKCAFAQYGGCYWQQCRYLQDRILNLLTLMESLALWDVPRTCEDCCALHICLKTQTSHCTTKTWTIIGYQ